MFKTYLSPSTKRRSAISWRSRRRAQSIVETTLCLVFILLPMVGAGLQFAIVINASHALEEIAREGARFAAVHAGESTYNSAVTQADPPSYRYYIKQVSSATSIKYSDLTFTPPTAVSSGLPITATFTYPMSKKMLFDTSNWKLSGFPNLGASKTVSATFLME